MERGGERGGGGQGSLSEGWGRETGLSVGAERE